MLWYLVQLLERHFVAALNEAGKKQTDIAKLHATAVTATLNAVMAYAEWAPLTDLAKSGIINGYVSYLVYYLAEYNILA
jgi:exportin-5